MICLITSHIIPPVKAAKGERTMPATSTATAVKATATTTPKAPSSRAARTWMWLCTLLIAPASGAALVLTAFPAWLAMDRAEVALFQTAGLGGLLVAVTLGFTLFIASKTDAPKTQMPTMLPIVATRGNNFGLEAKDILGQSFEYARETAGQAMEHRMTIVNFYLLIVGGAGSGVVAILAANNSDKNQLFAGAVALLWIVYLIGWLTVLKIIRLRAAWIESAFEMNMIKQFYITNVRGMASDVLESAFSFKPSSIPAPAKPWNIFYYSAFLVAMLDAGAFLGGFLLLALHLSAPGIIWLIGAPLALITLVAHMWVYDILLKPKPGKGDAAEAIKPVESVAHVSMQPVRFAQDDPAKPNEVIASHQHFAGKLLTLRVDTVRLPSGKTAPREIVEHGPAVVIVAYQEANDEYLLIEQYRDAVGQALLEVPAGMVDPNEDHETAARRELREETGYEAGALRYLGSTFTSPGFTNEAHYFYLATQLQRVAEIQDTDEIHALHHVSRTDAHLMIREGKLRDGKSVLGILWAEQFLVTRT